MLKYSRIVNPPFNVPVVSGPGSHGRWLNSRLTAFILGLLVFSTGQTWAAGEYWVSVGSYAEPARAERALDEAQAALSGSYMVEPGDSPSGFVYRILTGPYTSRDSADEMLGRARSAGFTGAWVLIKYDRGNAPQNSAIASTVTEPWRRPTTPTTPLKPQAAVAPGNRSADSNARKPLPTLVETPPASFNLHKLRRDGL